MKNKVFPKLLALLLVLCMFAPQVAMATVPEGSTCYIEVTIEDDKEDLKVSDTSSKYLTGASPLAAEVVTLIQKNYDRLYIFSSPAMKAIMDEGLDAFRRSDAVWNAYLNRYSSDVKGDLKNLLMDKSVTLNALEPNEVYKISFKNEVGSDPKFGTTYTVTITLKLNDSSAGSGNGSGSGSGSGSGCPYYADCPSDDYSDLYPTWYHESVDYVLANSIMNGIGGGKFGPYVNVTRGMLMTMLARVDGVNTSGSTPWYQKGMEWAVAESVSDGTKPEANITREQITVMLWRYAGSPAVSEDHLKDYPDADSVSSWAKDGMNWAVSVGIIKGTGEGKLNPQGEATRVELATMFHRYCVNILNK